MQRLDDDERAEAERDDGQQVAVGLRQRLVDDELHLERRDEGRDLQRRRQHQHLEQRRPTSRSCCDHSIDSFIGARGVIGSKVSRAPPRARRR